MLEADCDPNLGEKSAPGAPSLRWGVGPETALKHVSDRRPCTHMLSVVAAVEAPPLENRSYP